MDALMGLIDGLAQAQSFWSRLIWGLVGLALMLGGAAFVVLELAIRRVPGYCTEATLLGMVQRPSGNGKSETVFWPALDYVTPNGEPRRALASETGTDFEDDYCVGDRLKIRVVPHADFDDLYLSEGQRRHWVTTGLLAVGVIILRVAWGWQWTLVSLLLLVVLAGQALRLLSRAEPVPVPDPKTFHDRELEPVSAAIEARSRRKNQRES